MDASLLTVHENKFYADTAGTVTTQQRVRLHPQLTAVSRRRVERRVRLHADHRAAGRTRLGVPHGHRLGLGRASWSGSRSCWPRRCGRRASRRALYDLVVDPSNLWLTIHESIGHATELDRALGYEAAYAGTSFATFDQLGKLRYGSDADERHR